MIREREAEWIEGFSWIDVARERLAAFTSHAWPVAEVPHNDRADADLVLGCQTPVWLLAQAPDALSAPLTFSCSSDSPLVAGLVRAMASLYDGASAAEIIATEPTWITALAFDRVLSPTRLHGLASARTRIIQLAAHVKV